MLCYLPSSGFMISIRNPQSKSAILSQISFRDAMRYNLHNFMRIFISNCPTGNVLQNKRTNECILYKQTKSKGTIKNIKTRIFYPWRKAQSRYCILYHFNYSNRTVQSVISFTKITNCTAKIFQLSIAKKMDQDTKLQLYQEQVFNLIFTTLSY